MGISIFSRVDSHAKPKRIDLAVMAAWGMVGQQDRTLTNGYRIRFAFKVEEELVEEGQSAVMLACIDKKLAYFCSPMKACTGVASTGEAAPTNDI